MNAEELLERVHSFFEEEDWETGADLLSFDNHFEHIDGLAWTYLSDLP